MDLELDPALRRQVLDGVWSDFYALGGWGMYSTTLFGLALLHASHGSQADGVWRFRAPGEPGVQAGKLVHTIVPALVAQLLAAERSRGRPLTRTEVEELVAESPAIALEPSVAATMERSRGYADIEPDLAWEQWQLVRGRQDG